MDIVTIPVARVDVNIHRLLQESVPRIKSKQSGHKGPVGFAIRHPGAANQHIAVFMGLDFSHRPLDIRDTDDRESRDCG